MELKFIIGAIGAGFIVIGVTEIVIRLTRRKA